MSSSIQETYEFPSKGKLEGIPKSFTIRSMTTMEEKKLLGVSNLPFKLLRDVINACIVEPKGFDCYDLPLGDFQFIYHKLRVVTYGNIYEILQVCPYCLKVSKLQIDLDALPVIEFDPAQLDKLNITLPRSGDKIKAKMMTPRILDEIASEVNDATAKGQSKAESEYMWSLIKLIDTVNGEKLNELQVRKYVQEMQALDSRTLNKAVSSIGFGVQTENIVSQCTNCGKTFPHSLPINKEFL